ncbi:Pisatin demethylase [Tolypocladium ophioglossoides CBS 100239]|uniref:Pisatin demethylase n=1 Tax=Tolypocladium ophioglossoides (strain CBS 100239) TaxID=1163406 RepID=A0A0L0NF74_TOLOC|nr:Pisatin demethylase [Tolypocladium ophioglossoides CBS 100239]
MARDLLLAGFAVLVGLWSATSTLRQFLRLRHIPGPPSAGFSRWWLLRAVAGGRTHLDLYEACQKFGSVARVGPNDLVTSDPDLVKRMLNVRTPYRRSDWYDASRLDPSQDNVISMRDEKAHAKLRSKMAAGYSGKEVEDLEAKINQNVLALVDLLDSEYVSANRPFDFGRKAQYFTLDVISDLAFGEPFGDMATDSDVHEYISTIETAAPTYIVATVLPWLIAVLSSPLFKWMIPSEKDVVGLGRIMAIAKQVAAERFGPNKKTQNDMLGSFVARGPTQSEAESEILLQIMAGSDTTATAIRATMLHIMSNARVLDKLRAEIKEFSPTWPVITDAEARAMPYLQAVIKEGLRTFPPVAGLMAKEVPKGGDTFKGIFLPGGTRIGVCAWGVARNPEVWGQEALEFRPERWVEASPEKLREMDGAVELVFGHGRWQCLGRNVALMELNKVFVELFRRFDLSLVDPTQPWKSTNCGIFFQSEYWIKAYRRDEGGA